VTDHHQLCVRLPDLEQTVAALADVEDRLGSTTRRVGGLEAREAGFVASDLEAFADHWEHGVTTLRRSVGALRTGLAEVAHAYRSHEQGLAHQLGGGA
jgi:hypothetical protein